MTLVILICTAVIGCTSETALDVITRPANQIECAMPWTALPDFAEERNAGMVVVITCKR